MFHQPSPDVITRASCVTATLAGDRTRSKSIEATHLKLNFMVRVVPKHSVQY
jgi:hypothetical protein